MTTHVVKSESDLRALITKHSKQRERRVKAAVRRAARRGVKIIKGNIPVAFGELRESVHADAMTIVVDAPHAAAVNNGSRPHWMPLEPLIAWVKLRGMQGLATARQQSRMPGTTTVGAAQHVASMLREHEHRGPAAYTNVDAAEEVARMIQRAIAARGTKPHHFIEKSLPGIYAILGEELRKAIAEDVGGGDGGGEGPTGGGGSGGAKSAGGGGGEKSGAYRKNSDTYHGKKIQTDHLGRKFVDQKRGRVYLKH